MTRTERDRPAALAASEASHAKVKQENALRDAAPELVFQLLSAANYIDALGGNSKSYRAAIKKATGDTP